MLDKGEIITIDNHIENKITKVKITDVKHGCNDAGCHTTDISGEIVSEGKK